MRKRPGRPSTQSARRCPDGWVHPGNWRATDIRYDTFIRGRIGRSVTARPDPGDVKAFTAVVDNLLLINEYLFISTSQERNRDGMEDSPKVCPPQ
jgi:hypothetical protein